MSRKEKLLKRFLSDPKDFTFDEAVSLLNNFGFYEAKTGKTSGSRVRFENDDFKSRFIRLHRPHPGNILKPYQLEEIYTKLVECDLINIEDEDI